MSAAPDGAQARPAPVLEVSGVGVHYARAEAVRDVDLQIGPGEAVCLLGANGAGKSSTLKAIAGLVPASSGRIRFRDDDVTGRAPWVLAAKGLSYVPQNRRCLAGMSVEENLLMGAIPLPRKQVPQRLAQVYELFPVLAEKRRQGATLLSGGQQQMLAVGRGVIGGPRLLLLDEPSIGLSPKIVGEMGEWISRIVGELGMAALLVEQNVQLARACAQRGYVMAQGGIVASGPTDELAERVSDIYLGRSGDGRAGDQSR